MLQKLSNHPVHILDDEGNLSPTALIPFCEFGGNISAMGIKIDQFEVPVCNSFKPKYVFNQLCYEVDPNEYVSKVLNEKGKELGLTLIIDYNEDRQLIFNAKENQQLILDSKSSLNTFTNVELANEDFVYLGRPATKSNSPFKYVLPPIFLLFGIYNDHW